MEENRKTKIFFTDLDGTLLNAQKRITKATKDALDCWNQAGNRLVLCSGRAIESIKDVKETLDLNYPGMFLIGYNGGEIYDCDAGKTLLRTALTLQQTADIVKTAKESGIHCHTYTDTHIVCAREDEELRYYKKTIHTPVLLCEDIISALEQPPCKCIAIELHDPERLEQLKNALASHFGEALSLVYSNDNYLEIFPAGSGKGAALAKLCGLLSIPLSETLAAGDAANDISMLQAAGCGIAMLNARDEVKEAADIITKTDNNHDGLAEILRAFTE